MRAPMRETPMSETHWSSTTTSGTPDLFYTLTNILSYDPEYKSKSNILTSVSPGFEPGTHSVSDRYSNVRHLIIAMLNL